MAAIINPKNVNINNKKPPREATRITFIAEETLPPPNTRRILSKRKFAPRMSRREYMEIQQRRRNMENIQLLEETPARVLDGFLLLEACGVEFPDEASRAELQEMGLTGATAEDLTFFSNLVYIDVGDNMLPFECFGPLPALEELHIHCNMIKKISTFKGFPRLEILDLSYNKITKDGIAKLMKLPLLRVLDLTCNSLNSLPPLLTDFKTLEVLSLERNRLEREETLLALSSCPNLRELNLSHNFFRGIPASVIGSATRSGAGGFRLLEWLNLAHNYISREEDIISLTECPRLTQVILYGNPLTIPGSRNSFAPNVPGSKKSSRGGPSASVRSAINSAAQQSRASSSRISTPLPLPLLEKAAQDGRVLNFVTEPPNLRKRTPASGAYTSFKITTIKEPVLPTNAQWKEAGNKTLFDKDTNFSKEIFGGEQEEKPEEELQKVEEKDDDNNNAGILKAPTGLFMTEADMGEGDEEEENDEYELNDLIDEGMDELVMPGGLLQNSIVVNDGGGNGDPAKLRTALSNLRYALKHPLVADDNFDKPAHYMQHTTATQAQVKPRIPYRGHSKARSRKADKYSPKTGTQGRGKQAVYGVTATNPALANIEYVLDRMNARVSEVENDLGLAEEGDKTMASLINMVNGVMQSYEQNATGKDEE